MRTLSLSRARAEFFPIARSIRRKGEVRVYGKDTDVTIIDTAELSSLRETEFLMRDKELMRRIDGLRGAKHPRGIPLEEVMRAVQD